MRKQISKVLAVAAALGMIATGAVNTALAAEVTISGSVDSETHTYVAYQIFTGTVSESTLTEIAWASGVKSDNLLIALKADSTLGSTFTICITAADVAEKLADLGSTDMTAFAKIVAANVADTETAKASDNKFTNLADGYYLIKDENAVTGYGASTAFILEVIGDTTTKVTLKTGLPTLEKKVYESEYTKNDSSELGKYSFGSGYNDVADYSIGDEISFKLYGTVASDYDAYDGYYYQFKDQLDKGLSYVLNEDALVPIVTVDGTEIDSNYYSVKLDDQNGFTLTFSDLKKVQVAESGTVTKDSVIVVEYKAKLNENAEIGNPGNVNTASLVYANNPNIESSGKTDSADTTTITPPDETGETPEDEVVVLTYGLEIEKVDGDNASTKLPGVTFTLQNAANQYAEVVDGKVVGFVKSTNDNTTLTTDDNGKIEVQGLEDGIYTLTELKTVDGYNTIDPLTLEITATTSNGQTWTAVNQTPLTELTISEDNVSYVNDGIVKIQVANVKGSTLPSTGGMGTTIFYVIGLTLMAGAAVLLIAKKKTGIEE